MKTNNESILSIPSVPDKIKVVFNDDFTLCGDFHSMMEYNVSFYVKELNTGQLKHLYECGVNVSQSRLLGWFVIVDKKLIKEVDFYEY